MKRAFATTLVLVLFFFSASLVQAQLVNPPDFPSCEAPTGKLRVSYDSGWHGIVGEEELRYGSDKVYELEDGNILQCYCPEDGDHGIQTNWWKFASLSQIDISYFKNTGWHYIPSGRDWGLDSDPYLAKNVTFACKRSAHDPAISGGVSDSVLGLADTGGYTKLLAAILVGLVAIIAGMALRRSSVR